jgi:hypothetical protein
MLPVTDALSNLAQTVLTRLNRDLGTCLLTPDATCVERSPASNGRRGTTGKTTLKKKYRALHGRYRRQKNRYRSKVEECLELAVRNAALQSDVDALAAKLSKSRYVFTPPPLVVRCRLY